MSDLFPYRYGSCVTVDQHVTVARAFSLPPRTLVAAATEGRRESIAGQIAAKMALDALVETALKSADDASTVVRSSMQEANTRLYRYGAKMLSGAKLGTRVLLFAYDGRELTACRASSFQSFCVRDGETISLFSDADGAQNLLGVEEQVTVDLTSVTVRHSDTFVLTTSSDPHLREMLPGIVAAYHERADSLARQVAEAVVREEEFPGVVVYVLDIEAPAIELAQIVE